MENNVLKIENARLAFKNFSGAEGQYNREGNRNFCILLDEDIAERLKIDGWNVRYLKAKDENDPDQAYIQVTLKFGDIPPKVVLITSHGKTDLFEDTVSMLDWAEISNVDVMVRPYHWERNGKSGVKGYVKSMYITIIEDEFEQKYYDVPTSASSAIINNR